MKRTPGVKIGLARDTKPTAIGAFISSDMTLPGIPLPLDSGTARAEPEERWTLGGPAADDAPPVPLVERIQGSRARHGGDKAR